MRKAIEDKPPLAAWATLARDEAQMSVEEVVDALEARGHSVKAATIRGIEGGSKGASARLRKLMAEIYGTKPPGVALEATETPADLVAALMAQTKAISALVEELRLARGLVDPARVAAVEALARDSSYPLRDADPTDPAGTSPSASRPRTSSTEPDRRRTPRP